MRKMVIGIDKLVFDENLYPRMKVDWQTAYSYMRAIQSGARFPPILVGLYDGKYYVVDGWHRVETFKMMKAKNIPAVVKKYSNWNNMFIDAVKYNVAHGRQLTVQEKVRIVDKLIGMNFKLEKISEIIYMPVKDIKRITYGRRVIGPNGKPIYLKSIISRTGVNPENVNQDVFNVRSLKELLQQVYEILKAHPKVDDDVLNIMAEIYDILGEYVRKIEVR